MDRSFLSDVGVIKASRDFVCIRLASYEDAVEAEFLKTIYVGSTGELENTVFVMLTPDTKTNLCRPGRSPNFAFRSPGQLAAAMKKIAMEYPEKERVVDYIPALPQLKTFRLGLNVSSCDGLPSLICVGSTAAEVKQLNSKLAPLAFDESLAGKFGYASALAGKELDAIVGYDQQTGILIVRPGEYGMDGTLEKAFATDVDLEELRTFLIEFANSASKDSKQHNQHVRNGRRLDKNWETEIPVTDPMSLRAMNRQPLKGN